MFFSRRRKEERAQAPSAQDAHGGGQEPPQDPAQRERTRLLHSWRRSEQRVLRTWNAWQAAAASDRSGRYRDYLQALADEERAAEAVRMAAREDTGAGAGLAQPTR